MSMLFQVPFHVMADHSNFIISESRPGNCAILMFLQVSQIELSLDF